MYVFKENEINEVIEILTLAEKENKIKSLYSVNEKIQNSWWLINERVYINDYCFPEEIESESLYFPNHVLILNECYELIRIFKHGDLIKCEYQYTEEYKESASAKKIYKNIENLLEKTYISNLEDLFFDKYEIEIKNIILTNKKYYVDLLKKLNSIKRVKTKAGENFKNLNKNFISDLNYKINIEIVNNWYSGEFKHYNFYIGSEYFYGGGNEAVKTIEDIEKILIPENIERCKNNIKKYDEQLKKLHSEYLSIKEKCLNIYEKHFKNENDTVFKNCYNFEDMIIKLIKYGK